MKSASAVDTDAINNKAATSSLVDRFWNKQLNTMINRLFPSVHQYLAPEAAAFYLPDNIVVDGTSTIHHSDLNIGL